MIIKSVNKLGVLYESVVPGVWKQKPNPKIQPLNQQSFRFVLQLQWPRMWTYICDEFVL